MKIDRHHRVMLKSILHFRCNVPKSVGESPIIQSIMTNFNLINLFCVNIFVWSLCVKNSNQIMMLGITCDL